MKLCLYGAASETVPDIYLTETERLGETLARRGHSMIFGGGASGMMGAAARGVHRGGGHITGVAPRFFDVPGVLTPLCDELIITETMNERKAIMRDRADGFIAAPGGVGTLDEFFEALTLRTLGRHSKPVAVFNVDGYYDGLIRFLRGMEAQTFVSPALWDSLGVFRDPDELLDHIEARAT